MPHNEPSSTQAAPPTCSALQLQLLTIADVCRALRLGRTKIHALINEGRLQRVKIGRATRITNDSLLTYVAQSSKTEGQHHVG